MRMSSRRTKTPIAAARPIGAAAILVASALPVTAALTSGCAAREATIAREIPAGAGEFYGRGGVVILGYDPVAYFKGAKAVKGSPEHSAEYKGSVFYFSSRASRDEFAADPSKYAPQYGGFCAFGTASGYKAATDPEAFTVVQDKLYLNYNKDVREEWSRDIPGYVARADRNWPEVSRQTKVIE